MAMQIVKDPGFEDAMLMLYEETMKAEGEEYRKKNPEDPSNGHYERKVKLYGKEEEVKVPRTRKGA